MRGAEWVVHHRALAIALWLLLIAGAAPFAARLPAVLQGGADAVPGTESAHVTQALGRAFGKGALYQFPIVVHSDSLATDAPAFSAAIEGMTAALERLPEVHAVETAWNADRLELLGDDGHSALMIVTPRVASFSEAEMLTSRLRETIAPYVRGAVKAEVTGSTAMLHDLDQHSSSDVSAAERIGLPITLLILLVVFGAPLAALLPVVLALVAVTIGLAALFALSARIAVSVFAENVTAMIGLGVGVDYALFVLSRFREASRRGLDPRGAAQEAVAAAGHSVAFSGATVAVGFLALFLVRAPFLHVIAIGGIVVVGAAVAAAMTLLPALLATFGGAVDWPRRAKRQASDRPGFWERWAASVMRRPWWALAAAAAILALLIAPVFRLKTWNVGPGDLPPEIEARRGYDALAASFPRGWMGPIVLLAEARPGESVLDPERRRALLAVSQSLRLDPRSGTLLGVPQLLAVVGALGPPIASLDSLPEPIRAAAKTMVSGDGRLAIAALVTPTEPGDPTTMRYLRELRAKRFAEAEAAGLTLSWGGSSAVMADFDHELLGRLPTVVVAVVLITFVVLAWLFRSILIPLKATVLNTASVLAAYGFLVLVFQDGHGARWLGLDPPGGLNSFIVLMLFTILFGLSMDYEVFLLARVREAWGATGDNDRAVAIGLARTGGIITSAALIMVSIFAAFGLTRLTATREFGLGLAFAVALDASLIRVVLVPALMKLAGRRNWWWPFARR
jgi:putative drug exporter of the RND superfamily